MDRLRLEQLIREHKDSVYRQMVRVCGHKEDAEDALASALLAAFKSAEQLKSEESFRYWLGTIGKRVCTRMRAHPSLHEVLEFAEERDLIFEGPEEMDLTLLKGCVKEAMDHLQPPYRSVYEMCEMEERTAADAAERLGISEAAVKSRLHRARNEVRSILDQSICGG